MRSKYVGKYVSEVLVFNKKMSDSTNYSTKMVKIKSKTVVG